MKQPYSKPQIHVEEIRLDMPVAAGCTIIDATNDMIAQGWFSGDSCAGDYGSAFPEGKGDSLCYHSQEGQPFTS